MDFYYWKSSNAMIKVSVEQKKPFALAKGFKIVRAEGFEPSTLGAEIRYSIQLNYARNLIN